METADFYLSRASVVRGRSIVSVSAVQNDPQETRPPRLAGPLKLMSMQCYTSWVCDKHMMKDFVWVEPGTLPSISGRLLGVHSCCPTHSEVATCNCACSPNYISLVNNLAGCPSHVRSWPIGFSNCTQTMPMNISSTYFDNSIFPIDVGENLGQVDVQLK